MRIEQPATIDTMQRYRNSILINTVSIAVDHTTHKDSVPYAEVGAEVDVGPHVMQGVIVCAAVYARKKIVQLGE